MAAEKCPNAEIADGVRKVTSMCGLMTGLSEAGADNLA